MPQLFRKSESHNPSAFSHWEEVNSLPKRVADFECKSDIHQTARNELHRMPADLLSKISPSSIAYERERSEAALSQIFLGLVGKWQSETAFHSSLAKKFTHPAYQTIMAMG